MDTALGHSRHREARTYLVVNEPAALVWAANFGALEWHAWTSCTDQPHLPRHALIDIDPGPATSWDDVLMLARLHGTAMQHLGLAGQPKLTGRRGIQIWIPIARGPSFDDTRSWTRQLSRAVGAAVPELVSWEWAVADRGGLARLDYTQNALNKTLVAPYSPRAAAGAAVSAPIDWDELDDPSLRRLRRSPGGGGPRRRSGCCRRLWRRCTCDVARSRRIGVMPVSRGGHASALAAGTGRSSRVL